MDRRARLWVLVALNGGQLDGKWLLSPRSVETMRSVFVPDMTQTPNQEVRGDFENAVMHVLIDPAPAVAATH